MSSIDERMVALAEQTRDFDHAVNALEEKLQKVLIPVPAMNPPPGQAPRPEGCPLAEALQRVRDENESALHRIRGILGRLAL